MLRRRAAIFQTAPVRGVTSLALAAMTMTTALVCELLCCCTGAVPAALLPARPLPCLWVAASSPLRPAQLRLDARVRKSDRRDCARGVIAVNLAGDGAPRNGADGNDAGQPAPQFNSEFKQQGVAAPPSDLPRSCGSIMPEGVQRLEIAEDR
jgi:hypothetical protein